MKIVPAHKHTRFQPGVFVLAALAGGLWFFSGCSKPAPEPVPAPAPATPTTTDAAPAAPVNPTMYTPPATPAPAIATTATGGADLRQLNHVYIGWIIQSHQRPKTFEEFIAASGVQVPPAPDGKKYVIDQNGFINLASQ
jgi:hypothetical protein